MGDGKQKNSKPAPRHLKTVEKPKRLTRAGRTAAHRSERRQKPEKRAPERREPVQTVCRPEAHGGYTGKRLYYEKLLPYAEERHQAYQRSLRAGVRWLFALPVILLILQSLTGGSKIAFLIVWIVGMFIISAALIYIAYSDYELQHYLHELTRYVPDAVDVGLGSLLPVDENGNWTVSPEQLRSLIAQHLAERRDGDVSIRLPHELVVNLLQRGEGDRP